MKTVTTYEAKTNLPRLLKEVQASETILILNGGVPVAKLIAPEKTEAHRPPVGTVTSGKVRYSDDAFRSLAAEELNDWGL